MRAVPAWLKRQACADYGITQYKTADYEVDHLIPLSLILTCKSGEALLSTRLKAVSLIRVAIMRSLSKGALAIENAREFPSASVSGGFSRVRSIDWPRRN